VATIVLDTDVASNIIKVKLPPPLAARLLGHNLALTYVTLAELVQWVEVRHWGPPRRAKLDEFLIGKAVLPGTKAVAHTWGKVHAEAQLAGQPRPGNDSWIAATCLAYRVPLATMNVKDFAYYEANHGLQLVKV
jgi:toxin FitB